MLASTLLPLIDDLRAIVGDDGLLAAHADLVVYECDGFTIEKNCPDVAVFPRNTEQVAAIVRLCNAADVPFIPRGAGTSLAGGCLPVGGGVMIVLTRMREILEINLRHPLVGALEQRQEDWRHGRRAGRTNGLGVHLPQLRRVCSSGAASSRHAQTRD